MKDIDIIRKFIIDKKTSLPTFEASSLIYDLALRRKLIGSAEFLQHSSFDLSQDDMTANDIIEETENKLFQIEVSGDSEKGFKS